MTDHLTLLSRLKVKKIYWIDDENARTEDLGITQLTKSLAAQLTANESVDGVDRSLKVLRDLATADARSAARAIKAAWDKREEDDPSQRISASLEGVVEGFPAEGDPKAVILNMLAQLPQPFSASEKRALASAFESTGAWEWRPISFTQWANEHKDILSDHNNADNTALLIVDLQNDRESSPITGEDVLGHWAKWVADSGAMKSVFAIAFTSQFKQGEELKEGRRFTDKLFGATTKQQLPVLVLSKARLQQGSDENAAILQAAHDAFKKALGRLRACLLHWDLAGDVQKLFTESVEEAFRTLQELSIEELLMAVSGSYTLKEGASDVDTLVRMAAIAQRAALLTRIAGDGNIADILLELRGLTEIFEEFRGKELAATSGISRLRASEIHDPGAVVNGLLSPLATGDVFEITRHGQAEYYVLTSNICDLTLRGHTGRRKLDTGVMLRLVEKAADDASKEVPAFPDGSPLAGKTWAVDYHSMMAAPLEILDLCWTSKDGTCAWHEAAGIPERLSQSQHLRFRAMLERFNVVGQRALLNERVPGVRNLYEPSEKDAATLGRVSFDARRVGRIAQAFANAICEGFARNITRPSLDHDMSAG